MPSCANIAALFMPGSIAVLGASRHEGRAGNTVLSNILQAGYKGKIFPVNPQADNILGLPVLRKAQDIPDEFRPLDLAVICLPAAKTPEALRELAALPVRAAVVIGAGFKETGAEGARLERTIRDIARNAGIALLGPNCLGLTCAKGGFNATFARGGCATGTIGFFSQSGSFGVAMFDWAREQNFGFSSFISLGNKAVLDESDILAYLADDPDTKVIVGYLESVENGPRFLQKAQMATRKKPVILLKAGRTEPGARAASSHTGALAGTDMAYEAAFRQTGVIRAGSLEDLFAMALAFASQPLPKGPDIAIVTNAGGPAIVAVDACAEAGLTLARLARGTVDVLKRDLPPYASLFNPVDVISDATPERIVTATGAVLADPAVHAVLVLASSNAFHDMSGLASGIAALPNPGGKPILACMMGGAGIAPCRQEFMERGIPCYDFPEPAVRALAAIYRHSRWKESPLPVEVDYRHNTSQARAVINAARKERLSELAEFHAQGILKAYEIPSLEAKLARTSDEAVQIARQLGGPVALKIASPQILHKTDIQGVALHLDAPDKIRAAFMQLTARAQSLRKDAYIAGCLVQAMAPVNSREVIVGFRRDKCFGPMVIFGIGGIHVEAFKDISCRLAPLSLDDAHDMVREIRAFPLLAGMRGQKAVKFTAIEDLLLIMSRLALDFPDIQEAECNPVLANEDGALVADIRVLLTPASHRA